MKQTDDASRGTDAPDRAETSQHQETSRRQETSQRAETSQRQETSQRTDAQRNRERILAVALTELARDAGTPLSTIAKKACVGQGTLYRHFPNREALVVELYRQEMRQVADAARELLETLPPRRALREWMDRLAGYCMTKASLAEAIRQVTSRPGGTLPGHSSITEAIELLLRANEEAGTIRPGTTPDDFALAISGLWQIAPDKEWEQRAGRLLDLVMRGLSADGRQD
ncbi:TetR/AcrR family transcriptional regulator [Streptomyces sp. NPDC091377]|uniref:TetR/AcrR family transcriptional regulator n=1 Tax=Streptomyces sp. NPDC091377 TaxID=3365995 RepID=UPI0038171399